MTDAAINRRKQALAALFIALSAVLSAGCSGKVAQSVSQARLQAIKHNQRGIQEEVAGNRDAALAEFTKAFRLHGSIENENGMVVALVNMARTQRLKGELAAARGTVDRALPLLQDSSTLAPELFFENAKIRLAAGDLAGAKDWALKAAAAEKGRDRGRRFNLVASVLFRSGLLEQAREQAEAALAMNREVQSKSEEANSLRLLGELDLALGKHDQALARFQGALLLDKELGFTRKIAADLRGLGSAARKKEDLEEARGYYRRAMEVSLHGDDPEGAAADMATLAGLYRAGGELQQAAKLDEERMKLGVTGRSTLPGGVE